MNKNTDPIVQQYKKIAYETPILKKQEELDLIKQHKSDNNCNAKNKIINAYLRTVISLAEKYSYRNNLDVLDLIQCGLVGVMNSLNKFDLSEYKEITKNTGSLFAYYTYRAILMEMQDYYRNNIRQFSVTDTTNSRLHKINEMYKKGELNNIHDTDDMIKYISEKIGVKIKEARLLLSLFKPVVELDNKILSEESDSDGAEYKDVLLKTYDENSPGKLYEKFDNNIHLLDNIYKLDPDERFIITSKYGIKCEPKSIEEIAKLIEKSNSYVTLKIKGIQSSLRKMLNNNLQSI